MNLYDILLARCICGNKSEESIVATPLEVTENGEYEAEEGYAYNPVTVNVSSDFSTAQVTFEIGSGVGAFYYTASVDYPPLNPDTSSQQQYATFDVIGNTQDGIPLPEIDSTQVVNVLTYKGVAYISQYFTLKPYNSYDQIDISEYTLSGAAETVEDEESLFYGMIKVAGDCTITLIRSNTP